MSKYISLQRERQKESERESARASERERERERQKERERETDRQRERPGGVASVGPYLSPQSARASTHKGARQPRRLRT
jgi:hypothetical protein